MGLKIKQNRRRWRNWPGKSVVFEPFEPRLLLSAPGFGFTVAQIRAAYGLDQVAFGDISGDGSGQTIAIIDAYDSPNILSDLRAFDPAFGLADPPSFTRVSQTGSTTVFPGAPPNGTNWAIETALDVEWAHALAPGANILLVEANDSTSENLWTAAVNEARNYAGVSVVSMSFASAEVGNESNFDANFTTPATHNGVTFLAAAGDTGGTPSYPAASSNVIAVGGTSLTLNTDGSWDSESAWSSGGGGSSAVENQPQYQAVAGLSYLSRSTPDVSFEADPTIGVPVYLGGTWYQKGGTSFATPAWAAIIAIANQGRALAGLGTLDGPTDTLPRLYQMPASFFHDITTGSNPNSATAGYDLATGLGSPRANLVIASLASNPLVYYNMNTNPGWTLDGTAPQAWQYGAPSGTGKPTAGHTGPNVLGFNLTGNYAKSLGTLDATTPALDFTNQTNLILTFWRWLGVGSGSHVSVQAWDGTQWTTLWSNPSTVSDSAWVFQEFALPASTYNHSGVQLRWVMGTTSSIAATSFGWSIDDVAILGTQMPTISGQTFLDANGDGTLNNAEQGSNGVTVFLDLNNNGNVDAGEPTQVTSGNGNYSFKALSPGSYAVRTVPPTGFVTTNTPSSLAVDNGISALGNLGLFRNVYAAGTYTLSYDSTKSQAVISDGTTAYDIAPSFLGSLTFNANSSGGSLTVDFAGGDPVPGGGIYLAGGGNNSLNIAGGGRAFTLTGSQISSGTDNIHFANVTELTLGHGNFSDTAPLVLDTLTINPSATATLQSGGATPLTLNAISIDATSALDVADNGLIINAANPTAMLATLSGYLETGRNGGDWTGLGIRSAAAHLAYANHGNTEYTGLAMAWNMMLPAAMTTLDGAAVGASAVVIKYTYAGDADLDGKITIDDYLALDEGFLFHRNGYAAGDFDYSGTVDATDCAIIDLNNGRQGTPLSGMHQEAPAQTPAPDNSPTTAVPSVVANTDRAEVVTTLPQLPATAIEPSPAPETPVDVTLTSTPVKFISIAASSSPSTVGTAIDKKAILPVAVSTAPRLPPRTRPPALIKPLVAQVVVPFYAVPPEFKHQILLPHTPARSRVQTDSHTTAWFTAPQSGR